MFLAKPDLKAAYQTAKSAKKKSFSASVHAQKATTPYKAGYPIPAASSLGGDKRRLKHEALVSYNI